VVTVEEHHGAGGFGSAVLELLSAEDMVVRTRCLAIPEGVVEHGNTPETFGLDPRQIAEAVRALLRSRSGGPPSE